MNVLLRSFGLMALASLVVSMFAAAPLSAQRKTVWSGVFTPEQAARGHKDYEHHCTSCHGPDLLGGDGPTLIGNDFLRNWLEEDMDQLVDKVQKRMPGDAPGTLTMQQSSDIVSYLLDVNGFPPGKTELPAELSELAAIRIESKDGPSAVPNFSLVVVVGCLEEKDTQWTLTHGTEPLRTRETGPSADTKGSASAALGAQTFRLMDAALAKPENGRGQRVEVKGLLMRQPTGSVLNVTSIQPVSPTCP